MAAKGDTEAWEGAFAVLERHGPDARAFAAKRLDFCRAAGFAEGIALWSDILDKLAIIADRPVEGGD